MWPVYLDTKESKMENMDFESADPTPQTRVEVSRYKKIWSRQLHTKWHKEGIEMAAPWRG